jgi:hypothetical protein
MPDPVPTPEHGGDDPLPATMRFVLVVGAIIFVGWCLMYVLLRARW